MKLTIWGAAEQVTGSMHLLVTENNYKILIDCGLDYERNHLMQNNEDFPFNPGDIDLVVLTHAHIDHSGNLPTLVRMGFEGQILCTPPTAELAELLLMDSVSIFMNKAQKSRKHRGHKRNGSRVVQPLFLQKHVSETVDRFVTIGFNKPFRINGDIELTFIPGGHLLGAAAAVLKINDGVKGQKTIAFTGDIGRFNYPTLPDPQAFPLVDYLVSESTYGGRNHSKGKTIEEVLTETIEKCCVKEAGRLIIPAFSIGRTQALVYSLNKLFSKRLLPPVKVFVDSPMANSSTHIFRKHHALLSEESQEFYRKSGDEFEFDNLVYVENLSESRQVSNYFEPCIIISSAGMLEGGRIQDHLFQNIQNYYCTILFIGYCAKGTLGFRLLRGDPIVHVKDRDLSVYATIKQTDLFSAHGDHDDLVNTVKQQDATQLKQVFLVHGETTGMQALADALTEIGYAVTIAKKGFAYQL